MGDNPESIGHEFVAPAPPTLNGREAILLRVMDIVREMIQDWDRDDLTTPLTEDTQLVADLGYQSLDVVVLTAAMSRMLNRKDIPFERLLLVGGRPIPDLSLGALADFLWEQVKNSSARDP
jgi:acyl carrier protein